jgi:hypothetical protein
MFRFTHVPKIHRAAAVLAVFAFGLAGVPAAMADARTHVDCNYNVTYTAFGSSNQMAVWLPVVNPMPGMGSSQRVFWRATVKQWVVDANGRGSWTTDWTNVAYQDITYLFGFWQWGGWLGLDGSWLGGGGRGASAPTLFPQYSSHAARSIWVQDEFWYVNLNTLQSVHPTPVFERVC